MYGSVKAIAFFGGTLQQLLVVMRWEEWDKRYNPRVIARNEAISALAKDDLCGKRKASGCATILTIMGYKIRIEVLNSSPA